jgi:hypothetical protein
MVGGLVRGAGADRTVVGCRGCGGDAHDKFHGNQHGNHYRYTHPGCVNALMFSADRKQWNLL